MAGIATGTTAGATTARALMKLARNPAEDWWDTVGTAASARSLLETEAAGGRYQRSVYELFNEMSSKDGHFDAVLNTRLNAIVGLPESLQPASDSPEDREASRFVEEALAAIPRRGEFLRALLDSLGKGFAVVELLWGYDAGGRLVVVDWVDHPQEAFAFDRAGALRLLCPPFRASDSPTDHGDAPIPLEPGRGWHSARRAVAPPERKFVLATFGRDARNPYGRGLAQRAYWFYWFKKNSLRHWSVFNEKFGSPTVVASFPQGTTEEERRRLLEVMDALQTDAGVVVPEAVTLRLLEGGRSGGAATYRELAEFCNDEMSKIVLGATLTSGEGRRSGSLALGRVHDAVRQDYLEADARRLADALNQTVVRWLVDLNFGPERPAPRWMLDATPPADLEAQARVDRELVALGVPLPLAYFHEKYGRPIPADGEARLAFDDSNLFQYHVQYGVLTINEVRARLGLGPVPWGDERTGADPRAESTARRTRGFTSREERVGESEREQERAER